MIVDASVQILMHFTNYANVIDFRGSSPDELVWPTDAPLIGMVGQDGAQEQDE